MKGKKLIRSLHVQNLLSYGSKGQEVALGALNVIIGRNASGKSNLIEAIDLLHATPGNLADRIRAGGGIAEYLWKGNGTDSGGHPRARIGAVVGYPDGEMPLQYNIGFTSVGQRFEIVEEVIEGRRTHSTRSEEDNVFYKLEGNEAVISLKTPKGSPNGAESTRTKQVLTRGDIRWGESILSQRRDPVYSPEVTYLGNTFDRIRIYPELSLGAGTSAEFPQKADLPDDYLLGNGSNLGLVLDDLSQRGEPLRQIVDELKEVYGEVDRIFTRIRGNTVQLLISESGLNQAISANRLSDGTLRYLFLLTLLRHPEPPPLLCIEEPEIGLHPDILPRLAKLFVEASLNTQLIITTHSDTLVSSLSEHPEGVLVCDRDQEGSHLRRLNPRRLREWLEKYSLGELWRMGEIGGNRW
jgi:predicted ATPase